jgi:arsenite-transporting ATPase
VQIPTRRGRLLAAELDAKRALDLWLGERRSDLETIAERGTYLGREDVSRFLDLGLPGVDELVGLIELMRLVRAFPGDEVVVDTAPTAHTLRLLSMPGRPRSRKRLTSSRPR